MTTISLAEAQAKFPELIAAVGRGEQVVVTIDNRPVAKIGSPDAVVFPDNLRDLSDEQKQTLIERGYGCMQGKIWMSDDFDAPLDDFAEYR